MTVADQKKLRPRQIAAYQSLRPVVVDEAATCGAQIGVNLLLPDGTVGTVAQLGALFGSGVSVSRSGGSNTITTTDDLEEGQWNLWFTNLRAQDAVGGILANSANVTLAYVGSTSIIANLTTVTDAGGGTLQKTAFDAYGRKTGTSAATTADLAEGSNLYFTAARVLAVVLTGLSLITSAVIAATDTVLGALGKLQAQITDNLLPPGYIDGLKMVWVSGTTLTVTSGAAYVPSLGKVLRVTSDIAKTSLSLSASTWYHVYLYDNVGTPDVEIVTTAPATAYSGTARAKTGDTSRRHVGSVRTDASGNILSFFHESATGNVHYRVDLNTAGFRLVTNGAATSDATVACSGVVPVTARTMLVFAENNDTGTSGIVFIGNADGGTPASSHILAFIRAARSFYGDLQLTSTQTFTYVVQFTATFNCYCAGYRYER